MHKQHNIVRKVCITELEPACNREGQMSVCVLTAWQF